MFLSIFELACGALAGVMGATAWQAYQRGGDDWWTPALVAAVAVVAGLAGLLKTPK